MTTDETAPASVSPVRARIDSGELEGSGASCCILGDRVTWSRHDFTWTKHENWFGGCRAIGWESERHALDDTNSYVGIELTL